NWRAAKSQPTPPPAPVALALTPIAAVAIAEPVPVPADPAPPPRGQSTISATTMAHWLSDQPRPVTVISRGGSETMTASVSGVRWVTARAKVSADDPPDVPNVLPTPGERPAAPGTLVTSVTEPAAAVTQSTTTGVHPNYLVGEDPCCTCVVERAPRLSVTAEY